ncbi:MAG: acetoacetate--CoA ligase [Endozoicomonadaceae bacterium]|nr:acetoacetate--CoA ligase [Endozoicomonadaceae bacterium]
MTQNILWSPEQKQIESSIFHAFMQAVNQRFSTNFTTWDEVYQWSISNNEQFWGFWAEFSQLPFLHPYTTVIQPAEAMYKAQWFPDAQINYTQKIISYTGDQTAIIARHENGSRRQLSRNQLVEQIKKAHVALIKSGIKKGDCIAGYMPNTIETVVMMLAAASLGAVWTSCSPDFGADSVLSRFRQTQPKLLITIDEYQYSGKHYSMLKKVSQLITTLTSLLSVVIVPFREEKLNSDFIIKADKKIVLWEQFIQPDKSDPVFSLVPLPFNHPLYILYSSGTTGIPKCIIHGHGGSLIQHLKEHQLHTDIDENDRVFYFTTCGWMMWNWLVSVLASGACVVLYEGAPFYHQPGQLWSVIEKEKVTVFGTSARYISALAHVHYYPAEHHDLKALNTLLSTGSPLLPEDFDFVYQHIKSDIRLSSVSGGTDIVSCFVLGSPVLPVYRGEIQCRGLGMDVQFVDQNGNDCIDKKGELVCRQSFPSMPVGFFNDDDGQKYHNAYFSRFKNIWVHGDYGELTSRGTVIIYGRSDTTLNPGGVRIGTAEIYRQVEKITVVKEALVTAQKWHNDERVILFVILNEHLKLDQQLIKEIKQTIKLNASPRHVPAKIVQVDDFPRTQNDKISEIAVKATIHNEIPENVSALKNPEVLKVFKNIV